MARGCRERSGCASGRSRQVLGGRPRFRRARHAREAVERGRLIGFTDLVAGLLAASLALVGAFAYTEWGVVAIAVGCEVAVVAPAFAILLARRPTRAALEPVG